jgi:hypothetical protein
MANEAGQTAIFSVVSEERQAPLARMQSGGARAMWIWLDHLEAYERAEEVRYSDEKGRPEDRRAFEGDELVRLVDRPVIEAARFELTGKRLPHRQYNLNPLRQRFSFPTEVGTISSQSVSHSFD